MSLSGLMVMALVLMPSIPAVYADAQESSGIINLDGIVTQDSLTHETPQAGVQLVNSIMETMKHENVITVLPNGNLFQQSEGGFEGNHLGSMTPQTQMNAVVQNVMNSINFERPLAIMNEHSQISHVSGAVDGHPSAISAVGAIVSIPVPNSVLTTSLSPGGITLAQALTVLRENGIQVPRPPRGILAAFWAKAIMDKADQLASAASSVSVPTPSEVSVPVPEPTPSETPAPPAG